MAVRVAFAAKEGHPSAKPSGPWTLVVTNPYTGKALPLDPSMVVNRVDGVAAVVIQASISGRRKKITPHHIELINPHTGNTFLVHRSAILKENP